MTLHVHPGGEAAVAVLSLNDLAPVTHRRFLLAMGSVYSAREIWTVWIINFYENRKNVKNITC